MEGLELLLPRSERLHFDFSKEERRLEINLPELYNHFISLFHVTKFRIDYLKWPTKKFLYPLNGPIFSHSLDEKGRDVYSFEEFIDPLDIFSIYENFDIDDEIHSRKLIPIAISGIYNNGAGFVLGTQGSEADKIFIDTEEEKENRFLYLCESIFEFVSLFRLKEIDMKYVSDEINRDKLYKRWGEEFWRMDE